MLKLAGSWRAEDRAATTLSVPVGTPDAPAWLSDRAREEWERVVAALGAVGVLTKQDRALLAVHCHAWAEFEAAALKVEMIEMGEVEPFAGRDVDHPRVVMNRAIERLMKTADRFGMSAAARARLNQQSGSGKDEKPKTKARFFPDGPATRGTA